LSTMNKATVLSAPGAIGWNVAGWEKTGGGFIRLRFRHANSVNTGPVVAGRNVVLPEPSGRMATRICVGRWRTR